MSSPARFDRDALLAFLRHEGVAFECVSHAPLMTVADARSIRGPGDSGQGCIKNLFVKNKKGAMWLLTLHENTTIDLKQTAKAVGAGRFSFCNEDRLMQYLGLAPGAVSPLGLLNDRECEVTFYMDETLFGHDLIHVHPLVNTMTVSLATPDLVALLERHGHPVNVLKTEPPA